MIVQEQKAIKKALLDFADKNYLQLRDVQHASTEEVFYLINRYHQRVAILHYGGHADGQSLQMEREIGVVQTANVKGIAGLLGTQKQLKLVFLNGCASRGQVKALLDQGVPAVIATRVAVKDAEAQLFATQFYEALGTGSTIREAFTKAKGRLETERGIYHIKDIEETRGIKLDGIAEEEEIPWGLYWRSGADAILDWKVITESPFDLYINTDGMAGKRNAVINSYLVLETLKAIPYGRYAKELFEKLKREIQEGRAKRPPTDAEMKDVVVRSYLAPISAHLRMLFSHELSENYDERRLWQLRTTYQESVKLFAFILLSDLWDARLRREKPLAISDADRLQLKAFFELNEFTAASFDYFQLVDALLGIINDNEVEYYIKELNKYEKSWSDNKKLAIANEHFQFMGTVLEEDVPSRLIEAYCIQSEQELAHALAEWHFLINYKMSVIKNIEVQSIRNMPPATFKHAMVELDNNFNDIGHKDRWEDLTEPTNMESVLLYRNTLTDSLNLSPFVLDENALIREFNYKIYFFSYQSEAGLHYTWVENDQDTLVITDSQFQYVKHQFEKAREDILEEKPVGRTQSEIAEDDDILSFL